MKSTTFVDFLGNWRHIKLRDRMIEGVDIANLTNDNLPYHQVLAWTLKKIQNAD